MRKERYDKFIGEIAAELFTRVHSTREYISGMFESRHDGPLILTLKSLRRCLKRNIKEYRQQCAVLVALKKQIAQPVIYKDTARETKEFCPNCYEDFEGKEWHYEYCPSCGQKLKWEKNKEEGE